MKTKKLTPLSKFLLLILCVVVIGGIGYKFVLPKLSSMHKTAAKKANTKVSTDQLYKEAGKIDKSSAAMKISLDEWIGWKPILDANGGLTTKSGSIYDKLGLKLNISVINDGTQSSNALVKGDLNGAGYTINRFAFLNDKFKSANVNVEMPYVTNSSTGGDGIIAKTGINRIEDLVNKKIGVPRYSEAQTLVEWLMSKSSLSQDQITAIRKNMVFFDTPDDCAKAFFAGKLDAAATWQPYLSQAQQATSSHVLFSTKNATNIIIDGVVFRKDYIDSHKDQVKKFIEGALKANSMYTTNFDAIKSFPMMSTESNGDIKDTSGDATLSNCATNVQTLSANGTAQTLFSDMSNIWKSIGEKAYPEDSTKMFDDSFVKELASEFPDEKTQTVTFTDEQKEKAKAEDNNKALLTKHLSINFETGSASIDPNSYATLGDFANTAKILNGVVIEIAGNTDNVGNADSNKELSLKRAQSVAYYLQSLGIDATRFVVIGQGQDNPIGDNNTENGRAQNRRTDMYFKAVK